MRIFLSVGHSLLKNGTYTSAKGYCVEYKYCKKLSKYVKKELEKKGDIVDLVICPEKRFVTASQEREYKLPIERDGNYDLVMELHLNASDSNTANGCEVLFKSDKGKRYAECVHNGLAQMFRHRGVKKRDDLYMLNQTKAPAIIVESFFCTCKEDYAKAKGTANVKKLAKQITKFL